MRHARAVLASFAACLAGIAFTAAPAAGFGNITQLNNSVLLAHGLGPTTCGQPTYTIPIHIVPDAELPGMNARATWTPTTSGNPAEFTNCFIDIRATMIPNNYEYGCRVIIHEFGHLHGLVHSSDPNNIMWPGTIAPFAPCAWLVKVAPA